MQITKKINLVCTLLAVLIVFLAVKITYAEANDLIYQAKANHPPAAGGKLGIIWIDDTDPPMYSQKNAAYAVSFIQQKCYYTWQVIDAQNDFRRFIQSYYQGPDDIREKTRLFAKYSGYTYILALRPWKIDVERFTFNGKHVGYGKVGLKDVSISVFSLLYDANGQIFNSSVGNRISNQKGNISDIINKLWPGIVDKIFYKYQGFFVPDGVSYGSSSGGNREFGERTGKIP